MRTLMATIRSLLALMVLTAARTLIGWNVGLRYSSLPKLPTDEMFNIA